MDISSKISQEDKEILNQLSNEIQVLNHLAQERQVLARHKISEVLSGLGLSPDIYYLYFDKNKNRWEAKLKPDAISLPGQDSRFN